MSSDKSKIPVEVRKACMILGVNIENLSPQVTIEKWKSQIIKVHPDHSGDTEAAVFLNTAKDTVLRWLDNPDDQSHVILRRHPSDDDGNTSASLAEEPN